MSYTHSHPISSIDIYIYSTLKRFRYSMKIFAFLFLYNIFMHHAYASYVILYMYYIQIGTANIIVLEIPIIKYRIKEFLD